VAEPGVQALAERSGETIACLEEWRAAGLIRTDAQPEPRDVEQVRVIRSDQLGDDAPRSLVIGSTPPRRGAHHQKLLSTRGVDLAGHRHRAQQTCAAMLEPHAGERPHSDPSGARLARHPIRTSQKRDESCAVR
jgi:hypothetical protein